jgi:hypothetical protein
MEEHIVYPAPGPFPPSRRRYPLILPATQSRERRTYTVVAHAFTHIVEQ